MTEAKVVLSADASGLERGMRRAQGAIDGVEGRLGAFQKAATVAAAGLATFGGLGVVAALVQLKRVTVDGMDALNDFADATGATVENASALEDVALRTGTALEDVEGILVKFNATLKDAGKDDKATQVLKQLGLSVEELRRLDPAEALRRTAVELARFADDGNKARIIQELFGRNTREAAAFLKDLAEQGQLNATVTQEQTEQAEAFNEQLAAMQKNILDAARALTGSLLPALNDYAQAVRNTPQGFSIFGKELTSEVLSVQLTIAVAKVEELQDAMAKDPSNRGLSEALRRARADADALLAAATAANEALKGNVPAPKRRPPNEGGGGFRPPSLHDVEDKDRKRRRERSADDILRSEGFNFRRFEISGTDEVNAAVAARNLKEYTDQQERLNAVIANTPTAKKRELVAQVELLNKAFDEGKVTLGDWVTESERLSKAIEDLEPQVEKASDELSEFAKEARRNIQDALGDTLLRTFKGDTDDIVKLWGDMLLRMAAEAAAADLGKRLLGSGNDGDNGWFGTLFSAVANAFGGGSAAGRANGGPVAAGRMYEVNERGAPELLTMGNRQFLMMGHQAGYVSPGNKRGAGDKQTINNYYQTNHVSSGVTKDELIRSLQLLRDSMRAEFRVQMDRAGVVMK